MSRLETQLVETWSTRCEELYVLWDDIFGEVDYDMLNVEEDTF